MKRYIALLLVVVMLLSACGTTPPSTDSSTDPATSTTVDITATTEDTKPTAGTTEPSGTTSSITEPTDTGSDVTESINTEPTNPSGAGDAEDPTASTENTSKPDELPVAETLTITPASLKMNVGEVATVTATYNGTKNVTWTSGNTSVVSVNNGTVTALKAGTAEIIVKAGSLQQMCVVEVVAPSTPTPEQTPTLVMKTKNNTEIFVGDTLQIQYEYSGDKSKLTWKSAYTDTITVDQNGKITAVAAGNSIITVTDGTRIGRVNIYVNEIPIEPDYDPATSITTDSFNAPLSDGIVKYAGDSMRFKAKVWPDTANRVLKVYSSDTSIISVSSSYDDWSYNNTISVQFKSAGNATITVASADGAVNVSYSIQVKADYSCNPGSGLLTPDEFVNCVNAVMEANGAKITTSHGWRQLSLDPSKLTWETARNLGEGWVHEFWPNGSNRFGLEYIEINEDGKYVFRIHR